VPVTADTYGYVLKHGCLQEDTASVWWQCRHAEAGEGGGGREGRALRYAAYAYKYRGIQAATRVAPLRYNLLPQPPPALVPKPNRPHLLSPAFMRFAAYRLSGISCCAIGKTKYRLKHVSKRHLYPRFTLRA